MNTNLFNEFKKLIEENDIKGVNDLCKNNPKITIIKNSKNELPLHLSINANYEIFKIVLENTPASYLNCKEKINGDTPLSLAVKKGGRFYRTRKILNKSLKPNDLLEIKNNDNQTPLIIAAANSKDTRILDTLIEYVDKKNLLLKDKYGCNACENANNVYIAKKLINKMKAENIDIKRSDAGYVFLRAIKLPFLKNDFSIFNETNIETDLRKISRKKGMNTFSKNKCTINGNKNRSASMLDNQLRFFARVGYGIEFNNYEDIHVVSEYDFGSGKGKKGALQKPSNSDIPQDAPIPIQLAILRKLARKGKIQTINEVIMDIQDLDKIKFIFYNENAKIHSNEPVFSEEILKLSSVYMLRKLKEYSGKNIEIPLKIYNKKHEFVVMDYPNNVVELLNKVVKEDTWVLTYDHIDFWEKFGKEIKQDKNLQNSVHKFLEVLAKCIESKKATYAYDVIKAMYLTGLSNEKYVLSWCVKKYGNSIDMSTIKNQKDKFDSQLKKIKIQKVNVAKNDRRKFKNEFMQTRSELFILLQYGRENGFDRAEIKNITEQIDNFKNQGLNRHQK